MTTESAMFETMQTKYDKSTVTAAMCVDSFNDYTLGSEERACLVDLSCKITYLLFKEGKYDPMTKEECGLLITAMQAKK